MQTVFLLLIVALLQLPLTETLAATLAEQKSLPKDVSGTNLLTGAKISVPTRFSDKKGLVIIFMSAKCPCSDSHVSEMKKLSEQYSDFKFTVIHSNTDEPKDFSQKYFKQVQLPFEVIEDEKTKLADEFKAYKTPHAFLINPQGEIVYQGGVTNSSDAKKSDLHFLANALEDLSQGKPVRIANGRTLGCVIIRESEKNVW
jgi:peroxiredoxin